MYTPMSCSLSLLWFATFLTTASLQVKNDDLDSLDSFGTESQSLLEKFAQDDAYAAQRDGLQAVQTFATQESFGRVEDARAREQTQRLMAQANKQQEFFETAMNQEVKTARENFAASRHIYGC